MEEEACRAKLAAATVAMAIQITILLQAMAVIQPPIRWVLAPAYIKVTTVGQDQKRTRPRRSAWRNSKYQRPHRAPQQACIKLSR